MPRSQYVYVAVQYLGYDYTDDPIGVWTVKREMLDELNRMWSMEPRCVPDWIAIYRYPNGLDPHLERRTCITAEVNELLPKGRAAWS